MKKTIINALVYAFMFIAIQALAGIGVHAIWQQIVGGTDITTTELVVTVAVFSLLTIIIFLSAQWTVVSPRWLLTQQWSVLFWAVIAALGMVIPATWLQENLPELPNWIEDQQEQLLSNYWGYLAIGLLAPLARRGGLPRGYSPHLAHVPSFSIHCHHHIRSTLCLDPHEPCTDSLCLPRRVAVGMDVLAHWFYPSRYGIPLGKQLCRLYPLSCLSGHRHEAHRPFQRF